jgi:hypothetical protein
MDDGQWSIPSRREVEQPVAVGQEAAVVLRLEVEGGSPAGVVGDGTELE